MRNADLNNVRTPIQHIVFQDSKNSIDVKRDDMIPFSFGGNKVRIAREFIDDMQKKGKNCMIGYGNPRSNLCRALANMCVAEGVPCQLVVPSEEHGGFVVTANSRLVDLLGVDVYHCEKSEVASAIETVMALCEKKGQNPYYIYGDRFGKGNEAVPVRAYAKAYKEIPANEYDYIFLPTGTGMTQAGLIAGSLENGGTEKIIGISIARSKEKAKAAIATSVDAYFAELGMNFNETERICVEDNWLCGEYGLYNRAVSRLIDLMFRQNGLPLDPTYSGKAFYGMCEYLRQNEIQDKKILFLHTGGTPLFFDYMMSQTREADYDK